MKLDFAIAETKSETVKNKVWTQVQVLISWKTLYMYNPKILIYCKTVYLYKFQSWEMCMVMYMKVDPNFGTKPQGSRIWNNVPKSRLQDLEIWKNQAQNLHLTNLPKKILSKLRLELLLANKNWPTLLQQL
jgi:hypothetical protein